jgi:hypothetical protein
LSILRNLANETYELFSDLLNQIIATILS